MKTMAIILAGLVCCGAGCAEQGEGKMKITVVSPAFKARAPVPAKYTCDGEDVSPPLTWHNVPKDAQSIVLICDDPDAPAGTWVHWVCYDIPPDVAALDENMPPAETLPCAGRQGVNDFGNIGYGGPCPPGGTHRYFFKVCALDTVLGLPAGQTKKQIEKAMQGHVLASGELIGVYSRGR